VAPATVICERAVAGTAMAGRRRVGGPPTGPPNGPMRYSWVWDSGE
jgi:hypothetical protein